MNIFARFYFRAARLECEKHENKCSAKISTFTVPDPIIIHIPRMLCLLITVSGAPKSTMLLTMPTAQSLTGHDPLYTVARHLDSPQSHNLAEPSLEHDTTLRPLSTTSVLRIADGSDGITRRHHG